MPSGRLLLRLVVSVPRIKESAHTGWPTPLTADSTKRGNVSPRPGAMALPETVPLTAWPTPQAQDHKGANLPENQLTHNSRPLNEMARLAGPVRLMATGETLTGLDAEMASSGQLNPAHARWLMGLPPEWDACADMATQSLLNKPKRS